MRWRSIQHTCQVAIMLSGFSIMLTACENDLKDVEKISSRKVSIPIDKSTGVTIIYSDSAVVKAKLITPELLNYKTEKPYMEMNKGITVYFYDENQQEINKVTADYAIRREHEKMVELKRNVVVTNIKGQTFTSEELFWDENQRRFYSNRLVTISSEDDVLYGNSFWANEDFSYYEINRGTGQIHVQDIE